MFKIGRLVAEYVTWFTPAGPLIGLRSHPANPLKAPQE